MFLTVLTWRRHANTRQTCIPSRLKEASGFLWSAEASFWRRVAEKESRRLKESSVLHLPRLTSLLLFLFVLHPFVSRLPFVRNVSGSSFPFPDSWSELLAVWQPGRRGEKQMVRFSCHPVCLAATTGSKWRRIYSHTLNIYCTYTHTLIGSDAYTVTHLCVESFHTHFSHLHWRPLFDTHTLKLSL